MSPLDRFRMTPPYPRDTRVIGTHLFPIRLFGYDGGVGGAGLRVGDEDEATRVIRTFEVQGQQLFVTRMGGIFVRPPESYSDYGDEGEPTPLEEKMRFQNRALPLFNLLVCELALEGVAAEPVSTLDIARGQLVDGFAAIGAQNLAPDPFRERTAGPYRELTKEPDWWLRWLSTPESVLDEVKGLKRAVRLAEIAPSLPGTVAAALSFSSRRLLNEAFLHAWTSVEQTIFALRSSQPALVAAAEEGEDPRQPLSLEDFEQAVAEVLGEPSPAARDEADTTYGLVTTAHRHRIEFAGGGELTGEGVNAGLRAMAAMIQHVCGSYVAEPQIAIRRAVW
jgi:hypothetical protein